MPPQGPGRTRPRVLFISEDASLTEVGQMLTLAQGVNTGLYDVRLACGERYRSLVEAAGVAHASLASTDLAMSAPRVTRIQTVHALDHLRACVAEDTRLIESWSPDLIVGATRLSLGISHELSGVPFIRVVGGRWSPNTRLPHPISDHALTHLVGDKISKRVASAVIPAILRLHIRPVNRLRKTMGLHPVGSLGEMYSLASRTLYPDLPELAPVFSLPPGHEYIGPIPWETPVPAPDWWNDVVADSRPVIYASVGASGSRGLLAMILEALQALPVTGIVAMSDRISPAAVPENVFVANYLPGSEVCSVASVRVGDGDSVYESLAHGVPILGLPDNVDQHLCMAGVVAAGAGRTLPAKRITAGDLRKAIEGMLEDADLFEAAGRIAVRLADSNSQHAFARILDEVIGRPLNAPLPPSLEIGHEETALRGEPVKRGDHPPKEI